jgi:apolipoprotein N-acyltransferase
MSKTKDGNLLRTIAAVWSVASIIGFILWWSAISVVKEGEQETYVIVWLFLLAAALTGTGYLVWLGKRTEE